MSGLGSFGWKSRAWRAILELAVLLFPLSSEDTKNNALASLTSAEPHLTFCFCFLCLSCASSECFVAPPFFSPSTSRSHVTTPSPHPQGLYNRPTAADTQPHTQTHRYQVLMICLMLKKIKGKKNIRNSSAAPSERVKRLWWELTFARGKQKMGGGGGGRGWRGEEGNKQKLLHLLGGL